MALNINNPGAQNSRFNLLDDKNNPLNDAVKKLINSEAEKGAQRGVSDDQDGKKYPKGFTPPKDFWANSFDTNNQQLDINPVSGEPKGYGAKVTNEGEGYIDTVPSDRIFERKINYDLYKDFGSKEFTHLLDYFEDSNGQPTSLKKIPVPVVNSDGSISNLNTKDIYLGSFLASNEDNEDPTMLGYDLEIKYDSSPLFNGQLESFLNQYSDKNSEIRSRIDTYKKFINQLRKFLKIDAKTSTNPDDFRTFDNKEGTKVYYLKNLQGLDNLNEQNTSSTTKSFVKYGDDYLTLSFNEDITQNIGYLSTLYKMLTWSRINGRNVIPENLLRFDMTLTITEIRKFHRVVSTAAAENYRNGTSTSTPAGANISGVESIADLISKYQYTLYECQFFFDKMPHGDSLDLSNPTRVESFNIKINYKFSTLKFTKFYGPYRSQYDFDNRNYDLSFISPSSTTNNAVQNGSIVSATETSEIFFFDQYPSNVTTGSTQAEGVAAQKQEDKKNKSSQNAKSILVKNLKNAFIREANRQILTQAALLNKTLDNIRNSIPGAGRMSAPTNVYYDIFGNYTPNGALLQNDLINSLRNFVGGSIKGFFQKP